MEQVFAFVMRYIECGTGLPVSLAVAAKKWVTTVPVSHMNEACSRCLLIGFFLL